MDGGGFSDAIGAASLVAIFALESGGVFTARANFNDLNRHVDLRCKRCLGSVTAFDETLSTTRLHEFSHYV